MSDNNSPTGGVSFVGALGLLFIGLKLGHVIDWSWWLVTLPLWGGAVLIAAAAVLVLAVAGVTVAVKGVKRGRELKAARNRPVAPGRRVSIGERKDGRR